MARLAAGPRLGAASPRVRRGAMPRHVYRGFDLVLAPSRSMRSHLLDWGVERVALQPLGVDTARVPSRSRGAGLARRPRPRRGCARARLRRPLRAGEAPRRAGRRRGAARPAARAARRSAPGRCRRPASGCASLPFIADVAALASVLAGADAFVHAGDQETFGLSALEAMACGTPIVVRQAEGLAELADGACGLAVEHGTGAAFAEAIAALLAGDRPAQRRARPGAGRGQRLGAGAARRCSTTTGACSRAGRHRRRRLRRRRSKPRPCRRHDERCDATTITPSRFESERFVCVVLHDVAPSTRAACMRTLAAVAEVADVPATLLAVPRYHGERSTPELVDWLEARRRRGDELALHGWSHRDEQAPAGAVDGLRRRVYTRGEGEFWALSEREATRRIEAGIAWFREHGWPLAGFVAPAWLLGPGAWQALAMQRFEYTATLRELVHLPGRAQRHEPERRLQHVERLAAAELAALERGGRPAGARQPAAAHRAASARRRFRRRCAAPGRRCWRGRCATGGR